jgi:phosphoglycolate phosphatase-like HAD superfamily hydrolase
MALHTIIFDVEGTLVDCVPHVLRSWQSILATAGRPVGLADLQRYSGMDGGDMLERLLPDLGRAEKKRLLEAHGKLYCGDYLPLTRPFAGVRPLFVALKQQKYTLAIATSCTGDELKSYDETMQVLELVDAVACGDDIPTGKPHPDLFCDVLRQLQVGEAQHVMAVGDTPYDALGARPLGMHVVGVLTGGFSTEQLMDAGCDLVLTQVKHLADCLKAA